MNTAGSKPTGLCNFSSRKILLLFVEVIYKPSEKRKAPISTDRRTWNRLKTARFLYFIRHTTCNSLIWIVNDQSLSTGWHSMYRRKKPHGLAVSLADWFLPFAQISVRFSPIVTGLEMINGLNLIIFWQRFEIDCRENQLTFWSE